ncbi:O-antigen ligase family protein, partial [Verrucomicrobia bacterium]|nr:O-antigen ligase family protein [Verrucomicrobiota bacterium]
VKNCKKLASLRKISCGSDRSMGFVIVISCLFAPWAFGVVHEWSILTMNVLGFSFGFLGLVKVVTTRLLERGDTENVVAKQIPSAYKLNFLNFRILAIVSSIAILIYMFIHWLNARASFDEFSLTFDYYSSFVEWLPHSYDREKSWTLLVKYSSLVSFFWGLFVWFPERESRGRRTRNSKEGMKQHIDRSGELVPKRVSMLLTLIVVNAAVIALVGIVQRLDGNGTLLWIYTAEFVNKKSHFGPFAYRGNAAVFFNLIWPLAIYLFLLIRKKSSLERLNERIGSGPDTILIPVIILLSIIPLILGSRAGLIVAIILMVPCLRALLSDMVSKLASIGLGVLVIVVLIGGGISLGADRTVSRLRDTIWGENVETRSLHRLDTYKTTLLFARDHWLWGTGPGSFTGMYYVTRGLRDWKVDNTEMSVWDAWVHSDPLEILATFGVVGATLHVIQAGLICGLFFYGRNGASCPVDRTVIYACLGGFILHSCVDFPFQIYSLQFMFVVVVAIGIHCRSEESRVP